MAKQNFGASLLLAEHDTDVAADVFRIVKELRLAESIIWLKNGTDVIGYIGRLNKGSIGMVTIPALVLLNLESPIAGMDAMHALRRGAITRYLPAIIMARSEDERILIDDCLTGRNSCVARPLTTEKLAGAADRLGYRF